jgi:hypothetical protein
VHQNVVVPLPLTSEDDDGSRAPKFNVDVPETNLQVPVTLAVTVNVLVPDASALPAIASIPITITTLNIFFMCASFPVSTHNILINGKGHKM